MTSFREYLERADSGVPIEPITNALPRNARAFQGERAGLVSRLAAAGIDVALVFATVLGTMAVLWMLSFVINPVDPTQPVNRSEGRVPDIFFLIAYGYVLNWLYWTVCWAASGRTLGNLILGLRVINRKGKPLGWGVAALRSLFCTTVPVGLAWVIVSGANRSIQDVVLRTSVIYDWAVGMPTLSGVLGRGRREEGS